MAESVEVASLPQCNFCGDEARYDAKTTIGPWAYLCQQCWESHGVGRLGTGFGQRLVLSQESQPNRENREEEES